MTLQALRRRQHTGDADRGTRDGLKASESDSLMEPLLESRDCGGNWNCEAQSVSEVSGDGRSKEHLHWMVLCYQIIKRCAQWLVNIVLETGSHIRRCLPFITSDHNKTISNCNQPPVLLSSLQEVRLKQLKQRLAVPFNSSFPEHQDALRQLWKLAYPDTTLPSLKSELWKEMGWQGSDPSTDFRGGGFISLENLIFFAKAYPEAFQKLLHKRDGDRSEWEYPFAAAGINISFMLVQMLDLHSGIPRTVAGKCFLKLLSEDETAFDRLFCVAFTTLDMLWLARRASYMEFNEVLKSTRLQLEHELAQENVWSVRDLPSYSLLKG
ncbi:uncharacterized protein LOC127256648 [Andrographis paniculata]|uniref:uncharacterized protein LOC127256648 n=1 Tax=Andrographis paniculata TaxID=175694 RepID=UPI0021E71B23|nr:uncharacterized protein LOC127256648 [Andrographis paniculata]